MTVGYSQDVQTAALLADNGQVENAYPLLEAAMDRGDAMAAAMLAGWRMSGNYVRRDLELARSYYGRAAQMGLDEACPIYIAMLANGAGCEKRDWQGALDRLRHRSAHDRLAQRQLAVIEAMAIDPSGDPLEIPGGRVVSDSPRIVRFDNFLSAAECDYFIDRALPLLEEAVVVHPDSGALVRDPVRVASAAAFPLISEDPAVHAINRRIAAATATDYSQGEPLQVLSYKVGQQYKLHNDALPGACNQRVLTFLVYLNSGFQGGETHFPYLDFAFRGKPGDAIAFSNVDPSGAPDPSALHAGLPVRAGRKMLLSKWIRRDPLDLSGPPGRPM